VENQLNMKNAPILDKNWFDDLLKEKLWKDVLFRVFVSALISSVTCYFVFSRFQGDGTEYIEAVSNSLVPAFNLVGSIALNLILIAMLFKELETLDPLRFGSVSLVGKFGGIFRRLAADLSLWMLSALVTIIAAMTTAICLYGYSKLSVPELDILSAIYGLFGMFLILVSALSIAVRRSNGWLASSKQWPNKLKKPSYFIFGYLAVIFICNLVAFIL
jgi:hypothetical protein